jgi:hydroxypyruvate isomerase
MVKPAAMPLEPFVEQVAAIGYQAIELWFREADFDQFLALARKYHLAVSCMTGHASLHSGLNDPAQHERIAKELCESIDIAAEQGIPSIICFSGPRRPGLTEAEGIEITARGLEQSAKYAEKKGITLVLELLNSRYDHPGYQCDHLDWGLAAVQKVASPKVKLLYDIYHMQIMDGDIVRAVTGSIDWIGHFHTAGVPGRHDVDASNELNYARICQAIASTPYQGYVAHEYMPNGEVFESLKTTYRICDQE